MDIQVLRDALIKGDLQAWDNEILRHHSEKLTREFEARLAEERTLLQAQRALAQRQAEVKPLVHFLERRLGRTLTPNERTQLEDRVAQHGSEYVADVVMDYAAPDLAAWLSETVVPGNG